MSFNSSVVLIAFDDIDQDTTIVANTQIGTGSKIMTDQDAMVVLNPYAGRLRSVEMYFTNVSTNVSDSSRIWVKRQRSWSCAPLGNANPLQQDVYTLGLSKNIAVDTGWNTYVFDPPLDINSDSLYIWPDLIQQVFPRISYAVGNNSALGNLNGTLCATNGVDVSILDYACKLTFIEAPDCPSFLLVTESDSVCYAADTIVARAIIPGLFSTSYLSSDQVNLDTSFQIQQTGQLLIDMNGCN